MGKEADQYDELPVGELVSLRNESGEKYELYEKLKYVYYSLVAANALELVALAKSGEVSWVVGASVGATAVSIVQGVRRNVQEYRERDEHTAVDAKLYEARNLARSRFKSVLDESMGVSDDYQVARSVFGDVVYRSNGSPIKPGEMLRTCLAVLDEDGDLEEGGSLSRALLIQTANDAVSVWRGQYSPDQIEKIREVMLTVEGFQIDNKELLGLDELVNIAAKEESWELLVARKNVEDRSRDQHLSDGEDGHWRLRK